jgi:hypothetical protein
MDDTTEGFRLGEAGFFPWGTRFDAVVRDFEGTGYASRPLPCSEAYGFATRSAEPSAPRPDRPGADRDLRAGRYRQARPRPVSRRW